MTASRDTGTALLRVRLLARLDALHHIAGHVADDQRARSLGVDGRHAADIPARVDALRRAATSGRTSLDLIGAIQEGLRGGFERFGDPRRDGLSFSKRGLRRIVGPVCQD